jgi:hypothetical protein
MPDLAAAIRPRRLINLGHLLSLNRQARLAEKLKPKP